MARFNLTLTFLFISLSISLEAKELVIYSARNEQLIKPIFEEYTKETGVQIKFTTDKEAPLLEKIKAEGNQTSADIFMTVDAGNLWLAGEAGEVKKKTGNKKSWLASVRLASGGVQALALWSHNTSSAHQQ